MRNLSVPVIMLAALLAGCASEAEKAAKDQLSVEAMRAEAADKERAARTEKMKDYLDDVVPEWFMSPPKMDSTGIYGVGTASSKDLGFAIRKAKLQATYDAAKVLKQEMSGQERSLQRDQGAEGDMAQRTELLIDSLVAAVPVSGYDIVKNTVVPTDGQYHAFILMKIPFDEFNSVLKNNKDGLKGEFDEAFDKLQKRVAEHQTGQLPANQAPQALVAPPALNVATAAPANAQASAQAEMIKMLNAANAASVQPQH